MGLDLRTAANPDIPEPDEAMNPDASSTNFYEMVGQAEALLSQQRYAEAQPVLQRLLRQFPD